MRAVTAARLPPALSPATRQAARVGAKRAGLLRRPVRDGVDILGCCRPWRFGCQPIVDRNHDRADTVRHRAAQFVVGIQIAEHEPAAMREDDDGHGTRCAKYRPVDPHGDVARRGGHGPVCNAHGPARDAAAAPHARGSRHAVAARSWSQRAGSKSSAPVAPWRTARRGSRVLQGPDRCRMQWSGLLQDRLHANGVAVVEVAPNVQRRRPHRSGQSVVEGHPVQRAAHRDRGNGFGGLTDLADRRSDTPESGDRFCSLVGEPAGPDRLQLSVSWRRVEIEYLVLRVSRSTSKSSR